MSFSPLPDCAQPEPFELGREPLVGEVGEERLEPPPQDLEDLNHKAIVATERTLLTIIWTMLTTGALYDEPGPDWYSRQYPERTKRRALHQLHDLGYNVTLTPTGAA